MLFDVKINIVNLTFSAPRKVLSFQLFFVIRNIIGFLNKFSVFAKMATLGNSRNLLKSKMATRTHLKNKLSSPLT